MAMCSIRTFVPLFPNEFRPFLARPSTIFVQAKTNKSITLNLNLMTHQHPSNWPAATNENLKKGFRIHLLVFLLATPVLWLVWYLTDRTYPWPLWSTPAWAIGVLFHYLGAFVFRKSVNH